MVAVGNVIKRSQQGVSQSGVHGGRELQEIFAQGVGMHHAGMLRADRTLTERMFADGVLKVTYQG